MSVNADLARERQTATIKSEDWWSGGYNELCKRRALEKLFFNDPEFDDKQASLTNLSHKEIYEQTFTKAIQLIHKLRQWQREEQKRTNIKKTPIEEVYEIRTIINGSLGSALCPQISPLRLHFSMFLPTLITQATEEQKSKWLQKAWNLDGVIGTYAQTELGHGTFLRGLETIAEYDASTQEFVLNSPTLTAYKWWPGGLGHTANMTIVMANLYIKGKSYGMQPFVVRIRNERTHEPEPGVDVGEIGPKISLNGINNGFLGLKNVRIPLGNMLSKNNQVLPDGTFVKGKEPLLTYGTMVYIRMCIIRDVSFNLLQAAIIATRYSAIRRQGVESPEKPEIQILDYLTQQNKLFPQIAKGIFYHMTANSIWDLYKTVSGELEAGDKRNLPELHALTCCLKAICSHEAAKGVEVLRKSCGGHGFLGAANFGCIYAAATAACTYEGENTVLLLQTARFLIKKCEESLKHKVLPKSVTYLRRVQRISWSTKLETLIRIMEVSATECIRMAFLKHRAFEKELNYSGTNKAGPILCKAALMHGRTYLARSALENMQAEIKQKKFNASLKPVMQQLLNIYIMDIFLTSLNDLLRFSTTPITAKQIAQLEKIYEQNLLEFRKNAVAVADGFDFHDRVLNSTLGCYDGRAYERLMEEARKCELNQKSVPDVFKNYLQHLKTSAKL